VELAKQLRPLDQLRQQAMEAAVPASAEGFEAVLRRPGMAFICELKRASPSKGVIVEEYPYLDIARQYQQAGAEAVSVLTEPEFFKGSPSHLAEIAEALSLPALRKDFMVDEYQLYEARLLGAAAVLLIVAALSDSQLSEMSRCAERLGMATLVEAHDGEEVRRGLAAGARIIGVNNRNLKTFAVDLNTSLRLRSLVPPEILFVSESGISEPQHIRLLADSGVDAVLIGESLMRAADRPAQLARLQEAAR
jgi:indole-3-glycerol phosphate synthase